MNLTYRNPYEHACDCRCPAHHARNRLRYNDPGCHCLITCATQPMSLLAPQINSAVFLDTNGDLWHVPALEPGHWDWTAAAPIGAGHPLAAALDHLTELLHSTHERLLPHIHRL